MFANGKVLVISTVDTFTVKGMEKKIADIGFSVQHASTKIRDIKPHTENTELFIYYMDGDVDEMLDLLVYLKDVCIESGKKLILVGTRMEYDTVARYIPKEHILEWFERPFELKDLLEKVTDYMDEESREARKKCILIVDDDVTYMRVICSWLRGPYRVAMASSGIQAITWLAKNHADLILLDYEMPVTDGPQVMEMLRSDAATNSIPVMFLTGKSDKGSVFKVLGLKPVDYLLKTIDRNELLEKMDHFFVMQRFEEF